MKKKTLIVLFLLFLTMTPAAVNIITTIPISLNTTNYGSIIFDKDIGIFDISGGGGDPIDTPADPAYYNLLKILILPPSFLFFVV